MPEIQANRIKAPGQLSTYTVVFIGLAFTALLVALNYDRPGGMFEISQTVEGKRALANFLSRSAVTLISTVFACLFLAIPLTANIYTPQLISIFVKSWTNRLMLSYFVFSALFALTLGRVAEDVWVPDYQFLIGEGLVAVALVLIIPYLFSVFRFLDPNTIVARVAASAMRSMEVQALTLEQRRSTLSQRLRQLGNIALKALERSDREVSLAAVEALEACERRYLKQKGSLPDRWFDIQPEHFPGLSQEAFELVRQERTWVEMEVQRQFGRAYSAALAKVPDVISAISRAQRLTAVAASECGDSGSLDLAVRHFNNFLREAVKKRDIHAIYDLLYQYRLLGENLWTRDPQRVLKLAEHLNYYGNMAAASNIPFARDLVSYDLGHLLCNIAQHGDDLNELLHAFLAVGRHAAGEHMAPGIFKARLVTATRLAALGRKKEAAQIEKTLERDHSLVEIARKDLLGSRDPWFWEVTDRQQDLDYVDPAHRPDLEARLERLRSELS